MRAAAIVVIALALGVAAVPVVGAATEISSETTCKDLAAAGEDPAPGDNCFDGSTLRRAVVAGLVVLSAAAAVAAMVAGGVAVMRGSGGAFLMLFAFLSLALFFGAYVAVRV